MGGAAWCRLSLFGGLMRYITALLLCFLLASPASAFYWQQVTIADDEGSYVGTTNNALDVSVQDQTTEAIDLYLYRLDATVTLSSAAAKDQEYLSVTSITGVTTEDAITIYEGDKVFQSLVTNATGNSIEIASPLDTTFTTAAIVEVGPWKMNVNGSVSPQEFIIKAPASSQYDIYTIRMNITDNAAMDSALFGGIPALTKGLILRATDGTDKNLFLVVNNIGFAEQGFTLIYDDKAPSGEYGLRGVKHFREDNGVAIRLTGSDGDMLKVIIRDDLTGLLLLNFTISGHETE